MGCLNNRAEEGQNDKQHNKASSTAEEDEADGSEEKEEQKAGTKETQTNLRCLLTKMEKLRTTFLLQILLCVYGAEHRKQAVVPKNAVEDPGQHFRDDECVFFVLVR